MSKPVILTGIRSNEEPTLGNYIGAFIPMVELQRKHAGDYLVHMFVPDLHSFTTPVNHQNLYENTLKNLRYFMAAGLDINNPDTFIYRQSFIPAHSELTWILSCFTYFGELQRMTQFKEKSEQAKDEVISAGLFSYPILMAADILLYDARFIPVGEDQRQHLELTRDIAIRMNNKFGDLFTVPEDWSHQLAFSNRKKGVRIRSLRHPDKKMSKSVNDPSGTILLSDSPDEAAHKVMSATTDSIGVINYDYDNQPGVSNLITILALLTGSSVENVCVDWIGRKQYGDLKQATANAVKQFLNDFQAKVGALDFDIMLKVLENNEATMRETADKKLFAIQKAVGLRV